MGPHFFWARRAKIEPRVFLISSARWHFSLVAVSKRVKWPSSLAYVPYPTTSRAWRGGAAPRRAYGEHWIELGFAALSDAKRDISERSEGWRTHTGAARAVARLKKQRPAPKGLASGLWRRTAAAELTLPPARQRRAAGSGPVRRRRRGSQWPGSRRGHQRNTLRRESAREKR